MQTLIIGTRDVGPSKIIEPDEHYMNRVFAICRFVTAALLVSGAAIADGDAEGGATPKMDSHVQRTLTEGRQTFRFDTFGDEAYWGDTIKLHQRSRAPALAE